MNPRFFIPFFLFLFGIGFSQNGDDFCLKLAKINSLLQQNHYTPKAMDDNMSSYVYTTFLNQLDPDELLFLRHEIDSLSQYKILIDDAIVDAQCDFLNHFIAFYKSGLERQLKLLEELQSEPFHPELTDTLRQLDKGLFYETPQQIKNVFKKRLAYSVLDTYARTGTNKDSLYSRLPQVAEEMSKTEFENLRCTIENQLNPNNGLNNYVLDLFANVFSGYFDPHSNYFNVETKNDYFNSLTSGTLSFGLIMEMDDTNQVSVYDILTGSPAFREKQIEKGDRLIKVQHLDITYNVNCVNMNVVNAMFYSDTYKNLLLTFRKKNGIDYETQLQKELLKNYENTVFSFLIKGRKKVGYIHVPSFYSNIEGNTTNVFNDFFKEINHLKSEGAKGFIIDLQNNGGGDIEQALYMVSLFVEDGPIAILKNRYKFNNMVYNLFDREVIDEPLVVLINGYTASAGELFAAAIQDHKRGVLLGQRTYGKGTLQAFFPLDEENPEGELLKVTVEKMFRLNGKTHQLTGIQPDIVTPALLESLFYRENDYNQALKAEVLGLTFKPNHKLPSSHQKAIEAAKQRIAAKPHYSKIADFNEAVNNQMEMAKNFPINFESVFKEIENENALFTDFYALYETPHPITLKVLDKDKKIMNNDPLLAPVMEANKQVVLTNPDVLEAVYVLLEML